MARIVGLSGTKRAGRIIGVSGVIVDGDDVKPFFLQEDNPRFGHVLHVIDRIHSGDADDDDLVSEIGRALGLAAIVEDRITGDYAQQMRDIGLDGRLVRLGNRILMDLEPIDPVLEKEILRILDSPEESRNWTAFLRFVGDLYSNTTPYVRSQLFSWLKANFDASSKGFVLLDDGRIVGYKGCAVGDDGIPVSINHGYAVADGVEYNGAIPNRVGTIVEMPKRMVQDDPSVGCSTGLHVGTWDYASGWSRGVVLTVAFSARDVVSVPTDCDAQKLRVCRYEVLGTTSIPITNTVTMDDDDE